MFSIAVVAALAAEGAALCLPQKDTQRRGGQHDTLSSGRHIQYSYFGQAGLLDRITLFRFLAELGRMHDATVHLRYFEDGPEAYLSKKHSSKINSHWERYFDTSANGGNPFHPALQLAGCKSIQSPLTNFSRLFDDGVMCADITCWLGNIKELGVLGGVMIQPSRDVVDAADRIVKEQGLNFGVIHIRRCDRLSTNMLCTNPLTVANVTERFPAVRTWILFLYAEHGYAEQLAGALNKPGRRLVSENDLGLAADGDNYFGFMVSRQVMSRATVFVDTHTCGNRAEPHVYDNQDGGNAVLSIGRQYGKNKDLSDDMLRGTCE